MTETTTVTASSGTEPDTVGERDTAPTQGGTPAEGCDDGVKDEAFGSRNTQLRYDYLSCMWAAQQAAKAGDAGEQTRQLTRAADIANTFVTLNARLAFDAGKRFFGAGNRSYREDLEQAALQGLWKAFRGKDQTVTKTADGRFVPASGWDPAKGAFSTFCRRYVSGDVSRELVASEPENTGMSYTDWTERPKVLAARDALTKQMGRSPSASEIATAAGVTVALARTVLTSAPVLLSTPVGDSDGSATIGDRLRDKENLDGGAAILDEDRAMALIPHLRPMDALVFLMRLGLTGAPPRSVVRTADLLQVGRGTVNIGYSRALAKGVELGLIPKEESKAAEQASADGSDTDPVNLRAELVDAG